MCWNQNKTKRWFKLYLYSCERVHFISNVCYEQIIASFSILTLMVNGVCVFMCSLIYIMCVCVCVCVFLVFIHLFHFILFFECMFKCVFRTYNVCMDVCICIFCIQCVWMLCYLAISNDSKIYYLINSFHFS